MASVYNPTDKEISVMIKGITYKVGPDSILSNVPFQVARDWKEKTHAFISISEEDQVVKSADEMKPREVVAAEAAAVETPAKAPSRRTKR